MMSRAAWRNNDRIRTEGSRNLVEAALAGGASRYVQESVTFLYADGGSEWLDEGSPTQPNPVTASALDAEAAAGEFTASGGAGVVLRFGAFYGSDSEHTLLQLKMARAGFSALPGKPQDYVSSISTDDAAAAVLAALEVPAGIYNVVDDQPLTHEEYDRSLAEALGVRRLRRLWLPTGSLEHIARSHRVSNGRLRRVSAWEPRYPSVADAWSDLVAATAHRTPGGGIGSALGV